MVIPRIVDESEQDIPPEFAMPPMPVILRWRTVLAHRCGICPHGTCNFADGGDGQGMCAITSDTYHEFKRRGMPAEAVLVVLPEADAAGNAPQALAVRMDIDRPAPPAGLLSTRPMHHVGDGQTIRAVVAPAARPSTTK